MCEIQTKITIKAPIDKVWKTLTDFKAYGTWNPFITRIDPLRDQKLRVEMQMGKSTWVFEPTITQLTPLKELRWIGTWGNTSWFFKGEHYFILTEKNKVTHLIHGEKFSGIVAILFWPLLKKDIHKNFVTMNESLKATCETKKSKTKI
jgi:hypothetical protein